MNQGRKPSRRDPRFQLRPGTATVEFPDPALGGGRVRGRLLDVSVSGLAFELAGEIEGVAPGREVSQMKIRIGPSSLCGDLHVQNCRPTPRGTILVGGLFWPQTPEDERKLMTLLGGLESAASGAEGWGRSDGWTRREPA